MTRVFLFALLFVTNFPLVSCAERNYQSKENISNKPQGECTLHFAQSGLCADLVWIKTPSPKEQGAFDLKFYNKKSPDLLVQPNYELSVLLWMPAMGHGSSPVTIDLIDIGHYRVSQVFFVMSGEWDLHIQFKDGDKIVEDVVQKVNF